MGFKKLSILIILITLALITKQEDKLLCEGNSLENVNEYVGNGFFLHIKDKNEAWSYFPVSIAQKCFSLNVKSDGFLYFGLGTIESGDRILHILSEIMWYPEESRIHSFKTKTNVVRKKTVRYLKKDEYRKFWFSWKDDMFKVGRDGENEPFMEYEFNESNNINFIGIKTHCTMGASIKILKPNCPKTNSTNSTMKKKSSYSNCVQLGILSDGAKDLVNQQNELLKQIKFDYDLFMKYKGNSSATLRDLLFSNLYQNFREAKLINNKLQTDFEEYNIKNALNDKNLYKELELFDEIKTLFNNFLKELNSSEGKLESNESKNVKVDVRAASTENLKEAKD